MVSESKHALIPEDAGHGYGLFSARYGNIYTTRQLRELVQQAAGLRDPVFEFVRRPDGRWCDALRPRAFPDGFSSEADALADRKYHLRRVLDALSSCSVFVFTLGLTESWRNKVRDYGYGICPGVVAGNFDSSVHEFKNMTFGECVADLTTSAEIIKTLNNSVKILLTVSPVMLVATAESRGVLQSSIASKSILRAAADEASRTLPYVDYFPSYEMISGPQSRGVFYHDDLREVKEEGVQFVMDLFFKSRISDYDPQAGRVNPQPQTARAIQVVETLKTLQAECDEACLDKLSSEPQTSGT